MSIADLTTFKTTFANLPLVADNSYAANIAEWYANQISGLEPDDSELSASGWSFTFAEATFATQLLNLSPTVTALDGIQELADAWEASILASSVSASTGTYIPPPIPGNTFSVVSTTIIDVASIAAGKAVIMELVAAQPVTDALDSEFPEKLRDATLSLTITVNGMDSTPPSEGGPLPLTANNVGLV